MSNKSTGMRLEKFSRVEKFEIEPITNGFILTGVGEHYLCSDVKHYCVKFSEIGDVIREYVEQGIPYEVPLDEGEAE